MMREESNCSLPQDVMIEILMRLPLESVLALKRVSKQWKDLINDPKFFNRYPDKPLSVFLAEDGIYCLSVTDVINGCHPPPFTMCHIKFGTSFQNDMEWSTMVVCNWMAYVETKSGDFHLYNLLTGASYTVSDAPLRGLLFTLYERWICHGFGYDGYEDDYKILVVCDWKLGGWLSYKKLDTPIQNVGNSLFWVYSLRNRVWKQLEGFPYAAYAWDPPYPRRINRPRVCSINGVLHWGVCTRVYPCKATIVTYDLHTCRFGEILAPEGYNDLVPNVSELGGRLCCWKLNHELRVWGMMNYGVSESWTMLFRINVLRINPGMFKDWIKPVVVYEHQDGRKMLLVYCKSGSLYWYDDHGDEL